MKTQTTSLLALLVACSSPHTDADSGMPDSGSSPADGAGDVVVNEAGTEAQTEAGFPYPPAVWNIHVQNAKARGLIGQFFGVQVGLGLKGTVENDPPDSLLGGNSILQIDVTTGKQATGANYAASRYNLTNTADWWNLHTTGGPACGYWDGGTTAYVKQGMTGPTWFANAAGRVHVGANLAVLDSFSVAAILNGSGGTIQIPANGIGILENSNGIKFLQLPTTSPVAIDSVTKGGQPYPIFIAGRMDGPSFNFGAGAVNGSGFFLARYKGDLSALEWVKVFGGTPLFPASMGPSTPRQIGPQLAPSVGVPGVTLVFPFKGSVDFGAGPMAAGNTHAIALASFDMNGMLVNSRVFQKGAAAAGKVSTPSIAQGASYFFVDTVWDTVDVGGVTATAMQGADVYTATLGADFKPSTVRVYGGPGDDYGRFAAQSSSTDFLVAGDSARSIDFGLGPMTTMASNGQAFLARVPP